MLVRLCFTLGNLTASNNDNRRLIAMQLGGIRDLSALLQKKTAAFVSLLEKQRVAEEELTADTTGAADDEIQDISDVLVKLIRVLANLAIHEEVRSFYYFSSARVKHCVCVCGAELCCC